MASIKAYSLTHLFGVDVNSGAKLFVDLLDFGDGAGQFGEHFVVDARHLEQALHFFG